MGWPQITWIALTVFSLGIVAAKHGQSREPFSFWWSLTGVGISVFLLIKGGFFG